MQRKRNGTGTSATSATDNATRLGNVGIGISSTPAGELHLKAIGSANTWADMRFESTAGKQWSLSARDDRFVLINWSNATTSSDYLTILNSNGDVGIGTTSPISDLDVRGGGRITCDALYFYGGTAGTGTDNLPNVRIEDSYGMRFRANNDGHYVFSSQTSIVVGTAIQPNGTDFGLGNIVASGKIGIGKIPGTALLDIVDAAVEGTALVNVGNDAYLTDLDLPNVLGIYGQTDNTQGGIKLGSSSPLIYGYSGNVGIGTTSPIAPLQINGTSFLSQKISLGPLYNTPNLDYAMNYIGFNAVRISDNMMQLDSDGAHNGGSAIIADIFDQIRFINYASSSSGSSTQTFSDSDTKSKTTMRLTFDNKVIIGDATHIPLAGDHKLAVYGNIYGLKVVVMY